METVSGYLFCQSKRHNPKGKEGTGLHALRPSEILKDTYVRKHSSALTLAEEVLRKHPFQF